MTRHVIVVGLPGSGKTTAGRRAAEMLAADFTDLDEQVEAETGRSIAAIFGDAGEAEFRRLERSAMDRALAEPPHLIAAGAGWISQEGNFEAARAKQAGVLYLRVSPKQAAQRLGNDQSRPLLWGGDRLGKLTALLQERVAWYRKADQEVDGEAEPEVVARRVADGARELGGGEAPAAG